MDWLVDGWMLWMNGWVVVGCDGLMDGLVGRRMGWKNGLVGRRMDAMGEWMGCQVDGWVGRQIDECDGWMDALVAIGRQTNE